MLKRRYNRIHFPPGKQSHHTVYIVLLGVAFLFHAIYWCDRRIRPTMQRILQYECRQFAFNTFSEVADENIERMPEYYRQPYSFLYDSDGNITAVTVDAYAANRIQAILSNEVTKRLQLLAQEPLAIPIGTLIGIQSFVGRGPDLKFYISPEVYVDTEIYNTIESAGINQTRLSLYVRFTMHLGVVMAGYSTAVQVTNDQYLGEVLVLDGVPQSYRASG